MRKTAVSLKCTISQEGLRKHTTVYPVSGPWRGPKTTDHLNYMQQESYPLNDEFRQVEFNEQTDENCIRKNPSYLQYSQIQMDFKILKSNWDYIW